MSLIGLYQKVRHIQWRLWAIALTALFGGVLMDRACTMARGQEPARIRVEMFGWELETDVLVWSVSTGTLGEEGNFKPTGKPRTFAWNPKSGTITFDGTEHKVTREWGEHMDKMFLHVLADLYDMSEPEGETPGVIPGGAHAKNEAP